MHSIKYIPAGPGNDWRWAATLNDGEIDALWKEIKTKNTFKKAPVKAAELHEGGYLQGGSIVGSTMIEAIDFLSIAFTLDGGDGVCEYYTGPRDDISGKWQKIKATRMMLGKRIGSAALIEGGQIKPNGFVYGGKLIERYPNE
jgi:hypothetical protein